MFSGIKKIQHSSETFKIKILFVLDSLKILSFLQNLLVFIVKISFFISIIFESQYTHYITLHREARWLEGNRGSSTSERSVLAKLEYVLAALFMVDCFAIPRSIFKMSAFFRISSLVLLQVEVHAQL